VSCPGDMGTLLLPLNLVLHPAVYECMNLPPSMPVLLPNPMPSSIMIHDGKRASSAGAKSTAVRIASE
jgi:hypothetical protein